MLAIRLQRHGRKGLPMYRLVVQESNRHPSSGRVVTYIGNYDPRTKATTVNKEKASFYLKNGAQPSDRVIRLLSNEKVDLPKWVKQSAQKQRAIKNTDKLRKNQPKEEPAEPAADASTATAEAEDEAAPAEATDNK